MSDIFENDIDEENMNLDALEDSYSEEESVVGYEFDQPLYCLKLFYSCESLYAKNDKKLDLNPGDYVIVPTRYGRDLARVLGQSKKPMGVKPSDVIQIDRKASKDDIAKADENKKR